MSKNSSIEWTDHTWNVTTGCSKVSQGCKNCYAERIASRFWGERKFSDVQMHFDRLSQPSHWSKPSRIFVNSMSDLFHESLIDRPEWSDFITKLWLEMLHNSDRHTFIILTKRPHIMEREIKYLIGAGMPVLPNVWLIVSVEDQPSADLRIPYLLQTPAAVRGVSYEPALGAVDIGTYLELTGSDLREINDASEYEPVTQEDIYRDFPKLNWIIMGGESGPGARPMHPDWARSARDQCQEAGVKFFFKGWGEWKPVCPQYPEGDDEPNLDDLDMMAHQICLGNRGTIFREDYGLKEYYWCGYQPTPSENPWFLERVGKKAAGRLLDGRTWDEFPAQG